MRKNIVSIVIDNDGLSAGGNKIFDVANGIGDNRCCLRASNERSRAAHKE